MPETAPFHTCKFCDYKSKWNHNVLRHTVTKHPQNDATPNVAQATPNVTLATPNVTLSTPNVTRIATPDESIPQNCRTCYKCDKVFSRHNVLTRHVIHCTGLSSLQCPICQKLVNSRGSKYKHVKACRAKREEESKALVVVQPLEVELQLPELLAQTEVIPLQEPTSATIANTTNNITINGDVQQNNNITNNNITQNIIVFQHNEPLLHDHITKKALRKILQSHHCNYSDLLTAFSQEVLKRKENQCVRKTNLRSTSSAVHVGNDVWEARTDKQVIPKLLCNLAMTFAGSMETYKLAIQKALDQFIEDVTCDGEHGNDDAEEIAHMQKLYKNTIGNVKHILFNVTKQTMGEKKANAMLC